MVMLILGLGSNVGDRLAHLRGALRLIKTIPGLEVKQVSPVYLSDALLPENSPPEWDVPYLNAALRCESTQPPHDILKKLKAIEKILDRDLRSLRWSPRIIDIDILAWDDTIIQSETLTAPHSNLLERPFALWPLADVAPLWICPVGTLVGQTAAQLVEKWGSRFTGQAPFHTRQINQRLDTPQLVGILNVTPDSFSDGGCYVDAEKALAQVVHLVHSGADVIDIGAESTAPQAKPITPAEEWQRLETLLIAIKEARHHFLVPPKMSIDTRHVETAEKALTWGADWINDVSGLDNRSMRKLIAQSKTECVVMHHLNIPEVRQHSLPRNQDPVPSVYEWGKQRLEELEQEGIARENIIFDPGIGFGKMAEQSLVLLQHAQQFTQLGVRVLIGHSRKTFISLFSGLPFIERDIETLVIALKLAEQGIDYLRVHDVEMCARGLKVAAAMGQGIK